jgi:hypothetical protein
VEARLADVLQCESALEARRAMEQQLPTFTTACQNVATVAARLNALPTTPANDGGKVYRRLKSILNVATVQQVESSQLHQARATILTPADPKDGEHKATQGSLDAGMASSPKGFSACGRPGRPSVWSKPPTYRRHCPGDDGV